MNEQIEELKCRVQVAKEQLEEAEANLIVAESLPENNFFGRLEEAMMGKWSLITSALVVSFNIFMQCIIYVGNPETGSISAMLGWYCTLCWIGVVERMEG
jgi:hypothetical protein